MWKSSDAKGYAAHNAIVSDANRSDCIIVIVSAFERRNGSVCVCVCACMERWR